MDYIFIAGVIIYHVSHIIQYIGLAFIVGSVILSLGRLPLKKYTAEHVRRHLAQRTIFGLEFIIIGDILMVAIADEVTDIMFLGGIVLIRVVLGYALRKEIAADIVD